MTAIFRAVSGSVSAPGITFNSDTTAGLFLSTTGVVGLVAKSLGLIVNSSVYCMSTVAVQAGGSGYAVGDTITPTGGTAISQAVLTVATLSGSAVATATVTYPGFYTVKPSDPVAQGSTSGSGSGATFNVTWVAQFSSSVVTNEAGALPWQRLGASSFVSGIMAKANSYDFVKSILTIGSGIALSGATSPATITASVNPTFLPNFIGGLQLSTAGSSSTMTISAGSATDSTNTVLMKLSSAISKTTASWAVGTGNGGIDTGSIANSTWYHFYEIQRPDTGVTDVVFSTNASAPTLPANYTLYRRIGSGKTDGSAQWTLFTQNGNKFEWATQVLDVNAVTPTSGAVNVVTVTVPTGIRVEALIHASAAFVGGIASNLWVFAGGSILAATPAIANVISAVAGNSAVASGLRITTSTSAQVATVMTYGSSASYSLQTEGWIDWRGQNV